MQKMFLLKNYFDEIFADEPIIYRFFVKTKKCKYVLTYTSYEQNSIRRLQWTFKGNYFLQEMNNNFFTKTFGIIAIQKQSVGSKRFRDIERDFKNELFALIFVHKSVIS